MTSLSSEDVVILCNHLQELRSRALSILKSSEGRWISDKTREARRRTAESYCDSANALLRLLRLHEVGGLPETLRLPAP